MRERNGTREQQFTGGWVPDLWNTTRCIHIGKSGPSDGQRGKTDHDDEDRINMTKHEDIQWMAQKDDFQTFIFLWEKCGEHFICLYWIKFWLPSPRRQGSAGTFRKNVSTNVWTNGATCIKNDDPNFRLGLNNRWYFGHKTHVHSNPTTYWSNRRHNGLEHAWIENVHQTNKNCMRFLMKYMVYSHFINHGHGANIHVRL